MKTRFKIYVGLSSDHTMCCYFALNSKLYKIVLSTLQLVHIYSTVYEKVDSSSIYTAIMKAKDECTWILFCVTLQGISRVLPSPQQHQTPQTWLRLSWQQITNWCSPLEALRFHLSHPPPSCVGKKKKHWCEMPSASIYHLPFSDMYLGT